jgi:hypothetical protein
MRLAYYARPIVIDGSQQELLDIETIRRIGYEPYPFEEQREQAKQQYITEGLSIYKDYVRQSDLLVFRAFPDGSIGAGVAQEIAWAEEFVLPILELPRQLRRRSMSIDDTRQLLKEMGRR